MSVRRDNQAFVPPWDGRVRVIIRDDWPCRCAGKHAAQSAFRRRRVPVVDQTGVTISKRFWGIAPRGYRFRVLLAAGGVRGEPEISHMLSLCVFSANPISESAASTLQTE